MSAHRRCPKCDRKIKPKSSVTCRREDCLEVFAYRLVKLIGPFLRGVVLGLTAGGR